MTGLGCSTALLLGSMGLKSGSQTWLGDSLAWVLAWVLCSSLNFSLLFQKLEKDPKNVLNFTLS